MKPGTGKCILSNDLPWSWVNIPECPRCKNSPRKRIESFQNLRLVLLPCSHTLCYGCIKYLSKNRGGECDQCSSKITFIKPSMNISGQFEYDFYAYGLAHYQTYILPEIVSNVKFEDFLQTNSTRKVLSALPETKCIECSMSTQFMCVQCHKEPYCNSCFVKVHALGKVISSHEIAPLATQPHTIGRANRCKDHNSKMDHYCQTCKFPICRMCCSATHRKHQITSLVSHNQKVDLHETLAMLNSAEKNINESKQMAVNSINQIGDYATTTAQDICNQFQQYHSILQNMEKNALIELKQRTVDNMEKIHGSQNCLRLSSEKIEMIKSKVIQFSKNLPKDINLATLHDEVMCLLEDVPTDLIMKHFDKNLFRFEVPNFNQSAMKLNCQVIFKDNNFSIKLNTFFGDDNNALLSDDNLLSKVGKMQKKTALNAASKATPNAASNTTSMASSHEPHQTATSLKANLIKTREVRVIEIIDPKTYCVQNVEFLDMADQFIEECNQCAMQSVTATDIITDDMVLLCEFDETKWYRGIVKEKLAKSDIILFLVDFGRTLTVNAKQLRVISSKLKALPAAASVFTIENVEPKNGTWSDESKGLLTEMTLKEHVTMVYDDKYSGDLITHGVYPTSVKDTLLYLQHAVIANKIDQKVVQRHHEIEKKKKSLIGNMKKAKGFKKQPIKLDECFLAKVINIITPKEFFITKMSHAEDVDIVCEKVHRFYSEGHHRKIYYPHIGMACCVLVSDRWSRARIYNHRSDLVVEVFLVDLGAYCNVDWGQIRMLEHQFMNVPEGVSKCGLADIDVNNFETKWNPQATTELKRLCKNEILKVYVCELNSHCIEISLYVVKKRVSFLINAWLAKHKLAEWVGDNELLLEHPNDEFLDTSTSSPAIIRRNTDQRQFRQYVKITNIISPSEFYVIPHNFQNGLEIIHSKIEESMSKYQADETVKKWEVGDHCLVKVLISNDTWEWNRGEIRSIKKDSAAVFLRDSGKIATSTLTNLAEIADSYDNVDDAATKCHLANIKPTLGDDWAKSAIDEFRHLLTSDDVYDHLAASVCGKSVNNSLPVYLWGRKKSLNCALPVAFNSWRNINEKFALSGFADCIEKFKTIVECESFDKQMKKNMINVIGWSSKFYEECSDTDNVRKETSCDTDFLLESELDPESVDYCKTKVSAWLKANPIGKYQFTGIPTYVDNNAVIYLHATSQTEYLQHLKYTINKHIKKVPCDISYKWKVGDPCLVRFELDNCFYRGLIKEVTNTKHYKVEFVDYGNIEECNQSDIHEANILGNVPIQATKYFMPFLKPKTEDGLWDRNVLEFIHANIVTKMANVRVEDKIDEEYIPCTITVGAMCMNKVLINENLAENVNDSNVRLQHSDTFDYYTDSREKIGRDQDKYKQSSISLEKFKEKMAEKNEAEKQKKAKFNLDDMSADYIVENDSFVMFKQDPLLRNDEFNPVDNSTIQSKTLNVDPSPPSLNCAPFSEYMPSKYIKNMSVKIVEIIDPVHLVLEPIIEGDFIINLNKMEEKINKASHKLIEKFNFKKERACLARYVMDNCYYRAVIENPSYSKDSVKVMFVDYLESKIVERKHIRPCPVEVLEQPLKYFVVKLHGVVPYPRIRPKDIMNLLEEFKNKTVILKMVNYCTTPKAVQLYYCENQNMLIYQSLIDQKFYKQR